jgi:hypothetical protein
MPNKTISKVLLEPLMRKLWFVVLSAVFLSLVAKPSSAAVTLKQNWQAGQQLVYDTNIDGDLNLQIPATVPTFIAGMPLEIGLRGVGKTTLNTLKVNDFGDGTVQTKINPLAIEAETFGQKAVIKIQNGNATATLNGAPQQETFFDWNLLTNPPVAFTISPQLKITNIGSPDASDSTSAAPANMMTMIQNLILQSLPAILPTKSLNVGDQWTSDVQFKTSPAPNAETIKLGSFQFELKDPQTMEGRNLQHITVHGDLDLSSEQSKAYKKGFGAANDSASDDSDEKPSSVTKALKDMLTNHLFSLGQTVDGDLYFDTQAGQFVQADLNLDSQLQTLPDTNEPSTPDGFMNFSGTVRFKLSQVIKAQP